MQVLLRRRRDCFWIKYFIEVDKNLMTNVAGVFCAGDMIGGLLQISKAVNEIVFILEK